MHVGVFVATLEGGGAERVAVNLASEISALGIQADLLTCNANGPMRRWLEPDVTLVDFACGKVKWSLVPLCRYLRKKQPAALIAIHTDPNIMALAANSLTGELISIVITLHNVRVKPATPKSVGQKLRMFLQKALYPRADHMVAVSKGIHQEYMAFLGKRAPSSSVIYNPVIRTGGIQAQNDSEGWPQPLKRDFILAVGRLTKQKGFDILISAFGELKDDFELDLAILGEGEARAELEAQVAKAGLKNRVFLTGFVPNPHSYYRAASLFVLSSRWEGFGLVLVEALAHGLPVVSTRCRSGPAEILNYGQYGRLVPVEDGEALSAAMREELTREHSSDERRARRDRAQMFSARRAAARYVEVASGLDRSR